MATKVEEKEKTRKTTWEGPLESYPLENYPDYEPGKPAQPYKLRQFSYQDELEKIWGKSWGSQGIGRLRETVLSMPTEHELNPLWSKAPDYFLLRYQKVTGQDLFDLEQMQEDIATLGRVFEENGVKVHWWEWEDTMGAYGPMRKLFIAADIRVVRGGAMLPRCGHGAFKRGLEREMQKFLTKIGCPILHTFHGDAICEVGTLQNIAEDVVAIMLGNSCNEEGLEQLRFVLERTGVKEILLAHGTTTVSDLEHFGSMHLDGTMQVVDLRKAIIHPQFLSWNLYCWLRDRKFELIEVPHEEAHVYGTDAVILEPGKVIMPKGMTRTIKKLEQSGVEVIPIETKGLQQGGVNGILCVTGYGLVRDPGPGLDD